MTFLSAKNVTKFGTKLFTKLSENFGDSTNFSTKMSPKLVKIGWNHQNLRKFCRKSRWAHICHHCRDLREDEVMVEEYNHQHHHPHFHHHHQHHRNHQLSTIGI